jgi:hypothetical protein
MPRHSRPLPNLLAAAILALLPTAAAWAQSAQTPPRNRDGQSQGERQDDRRGSLSEAVRRVERDTRGEVLSAERVQYDGRDMHRVKVVDDQGRVRVFMQDPQRRDSAATPPPRDGDSNQRAQTPRRPPARDDDD